MRYWRKGAENPAGEPKHEKSKASTGDGIKVKDRRTQSEQHEGEKESKGGKARETQGPHQNKTEKKRRAHDDEGRKSETLLVNLFSNY